LLYSGPLDIVHTPPMNGVLSQHFIRYYLNQATHSMKYALLLEGLGRLFMQFAGGGRLILR